MNIAIIPLISTIVSFVFAMVVFDQFLARRQPYQLVWALGLFMYFIGTGTEFTVETWGLNQAAYRWWYLFGAIYVAAFLGMGTIYLLVRRPVAHVVMAVLAVASVYAAVRVFSADIDVSSLESLSGVAMPSSVRLLTPIFNTFGTLALVGGAIYSAWAYWRSRTKSHRVFSNILIAVGAVLPAFGGLHIRIGGTINLFYLFELLGIIIIFAGFLRSKEVFGVYRFPFIHAFRKIPAD
ncbi:MAG: hypothetical protein A2Z29_02160 [Chloroflexi bacterium RBG_16_56_11]|nr:MAG: hypothetical protein A2Z29_02160 [Chloroflexi bacterium RBG_16_56_11]